MCKRYIIKNNHHNNQISDPKNDIVKTQIVIEKTIDLKDSLEDMKEYYLAALNDLNPIKSSSLKEKCIDNLKITLPKCIQINNMGNFKINLRIYQTIQTKRN